jgi:hypothetical protein
MKGDTGSLSNLRDVDLGGLMMLLEMLEYIRLNKNKKGWSVKREKL